MIQNYELIHGINLLRI